MFKSSTTSSSTGTTPLPSEVLPAGETADGRILRAAADHLFAFGYNSLTMDDLAHDLGMSKKTLYVYFPGKEAIADAIVERLLKSLSSKLDEITSDPRLSFVEKLGALIETVGSVLSRASPAVLRDLQRFAPKTYAKIEAARAQNIPRYFGRLIREGIAQGRVRSSVDPSFAAQFWLQAMRGLTQPQVLEVTQLTPRQTLEQAIDLFFGGLLTSEGEKDYARIRTQRKTGHANS